MEAEWLMKQGDLDGALAALEESVRKDPSDPRLRIFLFQLLCVLGKWQRATAQLKTCAMLDPQAETMARMYRSAIICELYRERVFRGEKTPLIFGEPEAWMAWMAEALKLRAEGKHSAAEKLYAKAFDAAPAVPGSLNGAPFGWIADADPRLGPILELFVNGRYFWASFSTISRLRLEAPTDLRDRVWTPATVTWSNGGSAIALIPTRYAGTGETSSNTARLAQATEWTGDDGQRSAGIGQRMLVTDVAECALLDVRDLVFSGPASVARQTVISGHG